MAIPLKFGFVGDIFPKNRIPLSIKAKHELDLYLGNLESPHIGKALENKIGPVFGAESEEFNLLKKAGFDYLSLANNHIFDQTNLGISKTIRILKKLKINSSGISSKNHPITPAIITIQNREFAIFSITENDKKSAKGKFAYEYCLESDPLLLVNIKLQKLQNRIVIIFSHGGLEEVPLPSFHRVKRLRNLAKNGADLIIGSHPHVVQGWERVNGSLILYSLGDFNSEKKNLYPSFGAIAKINFVNDIFENPKFVTIEKNDLNRDQLLNKYIAECCKIIRSGELGELIHFQNLELFKTRYVNFILSSLKQSLDFNLKPFRFGVNDKFLQMLGLLLTNESHKEALLSPLKITFMRESIIEKFYNIIELMKEL